MENYDVVIIGAGPNGFTCGGYLAKAEAIVTNVLRHGAIMPLTLPSRRLIEGSTGALWMLKGGLLL